MQQLSRRQFLSDCRLAAGATFAGTYAFANLARAQAETKELIFRTTDPRNAEPALGDLVQSWITPTKHFYVRSHAPNPRIDANSFRLSIEGMVERPLQLSLGELNSRFPGAQAIATMTCAGNRRTEHNQVKKVGGVQWEAGAIGNAEWAGVRLSDVLKHAGVKDGAKHVWFEGLDEIKRSNGVIPFGASVPVEKVFEDSDGAPGTLLATHMNGQSLPPDHGYPLRTVVPGYIGARSVKWLGRIVVSDRPSPNHYVATAYKLVDEGDAIDWSEAGPIYRYVTNSVTCTPETNSSHAPGTITVRGYALPDGRSGSVVSKVEVSADGGQRWTQAALDGPSREYCWRLWTAKVAVTPATKELIVRANDSGGHRQPETVAWNMKGYLFNAWHRVPIRVGI